MKSNIFAQWLALANHTGTADAGILHKTWPSSLICVAIHIYQLWVRAEAFVIHSFIAHLGSRKSGAVPKEGVREKRER